MDSHRLFHLPSLAGWLPAQSKQHLTQRKTWLGCLASRKITDRCLSAPSGFSDLRLCPALARLDFGYDGFPLHSLKNNVFPLLNQRVSVIGFP